MSKTANQPEFPKTSVTVKDDRGRVNLVTEVTQSMKDSYMLVHGKPWPADVHFIPQRDRQGRKMQDKVDREVVYEGRALQVAINRAKRWMRSRGNKAGTPPAHIVLALMAFLKADPQQFQHCAEQAQTA